MQLSNCTVKPALKFSRRIGNSIRVVIGGRSLVTGKLVMVDSVTAAPTVQTGSVASGVRSSWPWSVSEARVDLAVTRFVAGFYNN